MTKREIATKLAWHYLGQPYIWGGDDPIKGFDCSGFVIELLKSTGVLPRKGDWKADALYSLLRDEMRFLSPYTPSEGCLVFWSNGVEFVHVEFCIDSQFSIGASGGGSSTKTIEDAIKQNAYIKIRPIDSRSGQRRYIDPFEE